MDAGARVGFCIQWRYKFYATGTPNGERRKTKKLKDFTVHGPGDYGTLSIFSVLIFLIPKLLNTAF